MGSYTNEVSTLAFDPEARKLTVSSTLSVGHHPSWITPHPTDKTIVFTALEQYEGKIIVLRLDDEGGATLVGEGPSGGRDPCALVAVEDQLLLGNVRHFIHTIASGMLLDDDRSLVFFRDLHRRALIFGVATHKGGRERPDHFLRDGAKHGPSRGIAPSPSHPTSHLQGGPCSRPWR